MCRQSYDVDIEVSIAGSGVTSSNTLDLKNPCFRYTGQPVQAPPGTNNTSPTDAYWASTQDATGNWLSNICACFCCMQKSVRSVLCTKYIFDSLVELSFGLVWQS